MNIWTIVFILALLAAMVVQSMPAIDMNLGESIDGYDSNRTQIIYKVDAIKLK